MVNDPRQAYSQEAGVLGEPIVQIAYFVNNSEQAAAWACKAYGAGPFFLVERIELAWAEHRGERQAQPFLHTSAYGQWGNVMMELVQQDVEGPSPFRDLFAPGEQGLHHTAMMVESLEGTYQAAAELGLEVAARAQTLNGREFAFIDTVAQQGHLLEVYERSEQLLGFYQFVADAARGWDGKEPVRRLG